MANIKKDLLCKTETGKLFEVKNIPSGMFEFFIHKRRTFKDGTSNWAIGVSPSADPDKGFTFEMLKGTEAEAEKRLDEIIKSYK